jgi:ketol-acid reductoisomerase
MNARSLSRAIRLPIARRVVPIQRRTIVSALRASAARPTVCAAAATPAQSRGVKTVDFAGHKEVVFGGLYSIHLKELLLMLSTQSVRTGQGKSS